MLRKRHSLMRWPDVIGHEMVAWGRSWQHSLLPLSPFSFSCFSATHALELNNQILIRHFLNHWLDFTSARPCACCRPHENLPTPDFVASLGSALKGLLLQKGPSLSALMHTAYAWACGPITHWAHHSSWPFLCISVLDAMSGRFGRPGQCLLHPCLSSPETGHAKGMDTKGHALEPCGNILHGGCMAVPEQVRFMMGRHRGRKEEAHLNFSFWAPPW